MIVKEDHRLYLTNQEKNILGMTKNEDITVLTGINICPSYQPIQNLLCGPQFMDQWTKHNVKRYHKSLRYAHMKMETRM